jgi:glucose-6-phosphate-specific signal transduction histidine kinase
MIIMSRSALGASTSATPAATILRSTVMGGRSRSPAVAWAPFERSLLQHCETIIANGSWRNLVVQLELRFEGTCPATHQRTILRVVDELLSNSMEHGFYSRQRGHVFVHVVSRAAGWIEVSVSDDGWGFDGGPVIDGNGFHLLRQIGELCRGAAAGPFVAKTALTVIIPVQMPVQRRGVFSASPQRSVARAGLNFRLNT